MKHKLIDLVKGTIAKFAYFKESQLFYNIEVEDTIYTFPIDMTDANEFGEAQLNAEEKASLFMRYIKKAIDANKVRWQNK